MSDDNIKNCKFCAGPSVVVDTAQKTSLRRRKCQKCGFRWTTIEISWEQFKKMDKFFNTMKEFFE